MRHTCLFRTDNTFKMERAAAAMHLTEAFLAPLYETLKQLDAVTNSAGLFNLCLRAVSVHARSIVDAQYSTVNTIVWGQVLVLISCVSRTACPP